ncbi:hypothetical protein [Agromyces aerolatus]|uniref:hypothetical protein n=1 Tax=Agromyces sp. LY-1074 TaxID=3074080 RepID=UPI00286704FE|nr:MULTISPECIES: hypothetical protein [unclassified Agromyces]MDR5700924.1 hypothetical protein [Agromyces sp. LY-1074]MDR5707415.1 hypothetical protein [Agromyces sp. LY-1358]
MNIDEALGRVRSGDRIDTGRDPQAVAVVGAALAERLRGLSPDALVCWEGDDESVIAHAVGVALGVPVVRAIEDMGILTLDGEAPSGARVVLLATQWGGRNPAGSLLGLLHNNALHPVALAAVLAASRDASIDLPTITLEDE